MKHKMKISTDFETCMTHILASIYVILFWISVGYLIFRLLQITLH